MTHPPGGYAGPHERYALRLADMFMRAAFQVSLASGQLSEIREYCRAAAVQQDIAANEARLQDRSDAALALRLRRMVQP